MILISQAEEPLVERVRVRNLKATRERQRFKL
jgi:hypothetical protein